MTDRDCASKQLRRAEEFLAAQLAERVPESQLRLASERAGRPTCASMSLGADGSAVMRFIATALVPVLNGTSGTDEVDSTIGPVLDALGLEREAASLCLYLTLLGTPEFRLRPPGAVIDDALGLLVALTCVRSASVWHAEPLGTFQCIAHVGAPEPSRVVREEARRVLSSVGVDADPPAAQGSHYGMLVGRTDPASFALVVDAPACDRNVARALAEETAEALEPIIHRDRGLWLADHEEVLASAEEKRRIRLGLDLHDGPLQDVAALAADVRYFRSRIVPAHVSGSESDEIQRWLSGFEDRLVDLDASLRRLLQSSDPHLTPRTDFVAALEQTIDKFRKETAVQVELTRTGQLGRLTESQKIVLLRVAQEALANVQQHSGASKVSVNLSWQNGNLALEIEDDGEGFDVERTLIEAAKRDRLGIVGMSERVRLVGGEFSVESKPGSSTRISVVLPEYQPMIADTGGPVPRTNQLDRERRRVR